MGEGQIEWKREGGEKVPSSVTERDARCCVVCRGTKETREREDEKEQKFLRRLEEENKDKKTRRQKTENTSGII